MKKKDVNDKFKKMTREDAQAIWGQHTPTKKKKTETKKKKVGR